MHFPIFFFLVLRSVLCDFWGGSKIVIIMAFGIRHFGSATLGITTFSIMTVGMKVLFVIFDVKDIQHNKTVIMLSVSFYLLLC